MAAKLCCELLGQDISLAEGTWCPGPISSVKNSAMKPTKSPLDSPFFKGEFYSAAINPSLGEIFGRIDAGFKEAR